MAKQKESPEATSTKTVETKSESVVASEKPTKKQDLKPSHPVPFARWFSAKGFKPHWRGGMESFADATGKKTMEEWDQIFKNY
jgi:hypothetical protein